MASTTQHRPIPGSERTALPGAHIVGTADPQERLMVTVLVRRRPTSPGLTAMLEQEHRLPGQRQHMRHDEFAAVRRCPDDLNTIEAFIQARSRHRRSQPAQRRVVLSGTVASLSAAFGVSLARYEHPGGTYRGRTGPVQVPAELAPLIQGIFGLDNRPQARPHLRLLQAQEGAVQPRAGNLSYTPL
jgi:kumamolisin